MKYLYDQLISKSVKKGASYRNKKATMKITLKKLIIYIFCEIKTLSEISFSHTHHKET